jgi:hypothetical protein
MNHLSTILVKYSELPRIAALSDASLISIFDRISGPSRLDREVVDMALASGLQVASLADANLDHVHVLRDGVLREVIQDHADCEDLRVIADVMRALGTPSRIDGSGRTEKSGEATDRQTWLGDGFRDDALVTLVVDHSFEAGAFGADIGLQIMDSVERCLAGITEQAATAASCGMVKRGDTAGADLAMRRPGVRKPLHIAALTPPDRSDVIITGMERSRAVRPYEPDLADLWVAGALDEGPRKEICRSILTGYREVDMKTLANVMLMHGYTLLDGDRVMRPYLWNKVNWGAR